MSSYICDDVSLINANCSLHFFVYAAADSNSMETEFPVDFVAYYNLTCDVPDLTAFYKIMPLSILVLGEYDYQNESTKTMIELDSNKFYFNVNESSTIQLCIFEGDDDDDDDHRICRQIHIGINHLYEFWTFPLKFVYLFGLCSLICYYTFYFLRDKWRKPAVKSHKHKLTPAQRASIYETTHDTFENEKVFDNESSDEEVKTEDEE